MLWRLAARRRLPDFKTCYKSCPSSARHRASGLGTRTTTTAAAVRDRPTLGRSLPGPRSGRARGQMKTESCERPRQRAAADRPMDGSAIVRPGVRTTSSVKVYDGVFWQLEAARRVAWRGSGCAAAAAEARTWLTHANPWISTG
jgi:hypothetical protein